MTLLPNCRTLRLSAVVSAAASLPPLLADQTRQQGPWSSVVPPLLAGAKGTGKTRKCYRGRREERVQSGKSGGGGLSHKRVSLAQNLPNLYTCEVLP